jgi:hypothetical protein
MTHNDRNGTDATFQGHYQDETVRFNVQQAYTGLPSDEMLLKTSRLMSRHVDPRITEIVQLTSEEIDKLRSDKALMDLKAQQGALRQQIIQEFGRMKDAEGSDLHQSHNRIRSRANNKMRALQVDALATKKKELRDFYAVDDVQRQLNGLPSTVPTEVPEPTYTHPERARIVEKLFSSELCKVGTDADIQNRVSVLTDLVALCKLKDLPRSRSSVPIDQNPKPEPSNDNDAGLTFSSSTVATSRVSSTSRLSFEHDMSRLTAPKDSPTVLQQPASARPANHQLSVTLPFEPSIGGAHYTVPCSTDLSLTDEDVVKSADTLSESSLDFSIPLDHIIRDTHFPEPAPTSDRVQTDEDVDMLCPVEADLGMNFGVFFDDVCPEPSSNEDQADDNLQPISLDSYTCLFCYFDDAYGSARAEASRYPRAFNMRRHAHRKHLQQTPSRCPDPACAGQQFKDTDHFMNHADGVHGVPF